MRAAGCAPSNPADIQPTGEDEYYRIEGDRKDKRAAYCLTIQPDGFAHGNFINFKTGDKGSWHSGKGVKTLTPDERKVNEARFKQLEADRRARTEARHNAAAEAARALWDSLEPATCHPYLERKGIEAHGARIDGADLIYSGTSDGKIWTYQRIQPDGGKLFLTGGKKQGCYYAMTTAAEDKSVIVVSEGVATAASIREATGLPVLAAFDAGNLAPVAKAMRGKYPAARIIIAADNDHGGDRNTGILSAQQAAAKIGGHVVWPEFPTDSEFTDFNDLHQSQGLDAVKNIILAALTARAADSVQRESSHAVDVQAIGGDYSVWTEDDFNRVPFDVPVETGKLSPVFDDAKLNRSLIWKKWPSDTDAGKMEPNSLHNILVFMRHKPKYQGLFRYDRFAGRIILHREPFWHSGDKFKVRELRDNDTSYLTASMERENLSPTSAKVREAIEVVAHENWINPPLNYFNGLEWDGVPRLSGWLTAYLGAEGDKDYLSAVGMAWLIAGVARIFEPGCKAENMLVLEGNQGVHKSTALSILANVGRGGDEESYFCDTLTFGQLQEKDTVLKLTGKLIVEFADLAGLGSREIEEVKSWMSVQTDEIRKPYGREMAKYPRQFILAGSTNESLWLKDQTGNRRFWPVKCGKINIAALKRDREQLWAEAVTLYKNKAQWWIGRENKVWTIAELEQDMRLLDDLWAAPIEQFVAGLNFITVQEILQNFKIDIADQNKGHQARVIGILKRLGFNPKSKWVGKKAVRGWERENTVVEAEVEEILF
jgi:putative DNA primase/helicase